MLLGHALLLKKRYVQTIAKEPDLITQVIFDVFRTEFSLLIPGGLTLLSIKQSFNFFLTKINTSILSSCLLHITDHWFSKAKFPES